MNTNWLWEKHPIVHLDFASIPHKDARELERSIEWRLFEIAQEYNLDISEPPALGSKFSYLIKNLAKLNRVVILIDEYDKPILDHISNTQEANAQRNVLKSFYDILKSTEIDDQLRAIFVTGVSKFSKTSLFSGLNNLDDITLMREGATLLGYTQDELIAYFSDYINLVAQEQNQSIDHVLTTMGTWYDGYCFGRSDQTKRVYNPYSVMLFLQHRELLNYWSETGNPTFLFEIINKQQFPLINLDHIQVNDTELRAFEPDNIHLPAMLLQTGYLTVISYNEITKKYMLDLQTSPTLFSLKKSVIIKVYFMQLLNLRT